MKRTLLAVAAAAAIALTGCSSNTTPEADATSPASPTDEPAPAESTPLSQAEWVDLCAPDGGTNPDDPQCTADQVEDGEGDEEGISDESFNEKQGEWFVFTTTDSENFVEKWDVRIDSAKLVDVIPDAEYNEDWDGGDEIPQYIDAKPDAGNEFLHIEYSVKNTNQKPLYLALESSVMFSDGEVFAPLGDDLDDYTPNLTQRHDNPAGEQQNPGTETQGDFVIEIPKDSDIELLIINDAYIGSGAEWTVDLNVTR